MNKIHWPVIALIAVAIVVLAFLVGSQVTTFDCHGSSDATTCVQR